MNDNEYSEVEYRRHVTELAEEVARQVREDGRDESDALHEVTADSAWVIYTYRARHVLLHSPNEDAVFDSGFGLGGASSLLDIYTRAARFALSADVAEELAEVLDDAERV